MDNYEISLWRKGVSHQQNLKWEVGSALDTPSFQMLRYFTKFLLTSCSLLLIFSYLHLLHLTLDLFLGGKITEEIMKIDKEIHVRMEDKCILTIIFTKLLNCHSSGSSHMPHPWNFFPYLRQCLVQSHLIL